MFRVYLYFILLKFSIATKIDDLNMISTQQIIIGKIPLQVSSRLDDGVATT